MGLHRSSVREASDTSVASDVLPSNRRRSGRHISPAPTVSDEEVFRPVLETSHNSAPSSDDELVRAFVPSKRKKPTNTLNTADDGRVIEDLDVGNIAKRQRTSAISLPSFLHPKSIYEGWNPPLPVSKERFAIYDLLDEIGRLNLQPDTRASYKTVYLTDFTIYRSVTSAIHPLTMASLNDLKTRVGIGALLFDGILRLGNIRRFVKGVPFEILAVDGYGSDEPSAASKTCIQSVQGESLNTWYLLEQPSSAYKRFYDPFVWLVDFAKHFVGYLLDKDDACLADFRNNFWQDIVKLHGEEASFQAWFKQFGRTDFRQVVAANVEFLWKEATDIESSNMKHLLWREIDNKQDRRAIKQQTVVEDMTIVTPFVHECFKKVYFASRLELRKSSSRVAQLRTARARAMNLVTEDDLNHPIQPSSQRIKAQEICPGDVVGIPRDSDTKWRDKSDIWYGYVQDIRGQGRKKHLHLIWLYRPSDTSCGEMYYPFANELFLSDHCNCGDEGKSAEIYLEDVTEKVEVLFCKTPGEAKGKPFIRQTFSTQDSSFRTFQPNDLICSCRSYNSELEEFKCIYPKGTTVLARIDGNLQLEVAEIDHVDDASHVHVKRLLRRKQAYGDDKAKPNELVYTNRTSVVKTNQIIRKCHVRRFPLDQARKCKIPAPYSYNGAGDCWILTGKDKNEHGKEPSFKEGFDPQAASYQAQPPLNGLGLFSGGGSFERGIEEGKGVKFKWAVDWDTHALHTYYANMDEHEKTQLFLGSVNDYHARALAGDKSALIAAVGLVQFIAAGSPCQGFSKVQPNKLSEQSLRNASMVASVATSVDIYLPERGLLENVHGMVMGFGAEVQNVFEQLVCCLVAMGYQVQQFNVDAWSSGSAQSRSRVFVSFTAPGLTPLPPPATTHSHPLTAIRRRLGTGANGLGFGVRELGEATPFAFTTTREATGDLPNIEDGAVGTCIKWPDHQLSARGREWGRLVIRHIPLFPKSMSWTKTIKMSLSPMPRQLIANCQRKSNLWAADTNKAFSRNDPDGVFPTIITRPTPQCTKNGKFLHWQQHRPLTIMEARRAQSYPDHEVLIGSLDKQWKIVGNSVARTVAVAFGMSVREAWLEDRNRGLSTTTDTIALVTEAYEGTNNPQAASGAHEDLEALNAEYDLEELPVKSVATTLMDALTGESALGNTMNRALREDSIELIVEDIEGWADGTQADRENTNSAMNTQTNVNVDDDMIILDTPFPAMTRPTPQAAASPASGTHVSARMHNPATPTYQSSTTRPIGMRSSPRVSGNRMNQTTIPQGTNSSTVKSKSRLSGAETIIRISSDILGHTEHSAGQTPVSKDDKFGSKPSTATPGINHAAADVLGSLYPASAALVTPELPHSTPMKQSDIPSRLTSATDQEMNGSQMEITVETRIRVSVPTSAGSTAEERQQQRQQVADTLGLLWTGM